MAQQEDGILSLVTQVNKIEPEIFIVPEADVVLLTEGSTLIADSLIGSWQGDASPAGSETVARYQMPLSESLSIANIFKYLLLINH